jgi:predicted  nucleic acid-binding Zn-ribbon protein
MNDHQRLITVWRLELKARVVKGELNRWQSSIQERVNTIHLAKTSIHQADIRHDELSEQLERWDDDLKTLARRVKLVEEGIQKGHFQDLDQAQSQIVEYKTKSDQLETHYLETLETQERLRFSQALSRDKIKYTQQILSSTTEQYEVVRLESETQLDAIFNETERLLEQMNPKVSSLYRLMVVKKDRAVVGVVDGACGGCFLNLPTELLWTAVHRSTICHCPNCSVFLIPEDIAI